jgi:hypothetical protein
MSIKANKVRTCLLLKIESEIEHFKSIPTKMNSISANKLYELYSNIQINIENPFEFFSIERRKSTKLISDDNCLKKDSEPENTPGQDINFTITKKLVSYRKNKNFLEHLSKDENISPIKLKDMNNSYKFNSKNSPLEFLIPKKYKSTKNAIHLLRQMARTLIKRRKHVKKSNSFYKSGLNKSQKYIQVYNLKNSNQNNFLLKSYDFQSIKNILYNINITKKKSPTFEVLEEESFLVHANSTVVNEKHPHKKHAFNNLDTKNNFCSMITQNGPSFNRRTFTLMNIQFEKEKLQKKKNENKKISTKPTF